MGLANVRRWTPEEDEVVLSDKSVAEIARRLDRTRYAVEARRRRLRYPTQMEEYQSAINRDYYARGAVHRANSGERWSEADTNAILAPDRPSDMELSRQLGRTVGAIQMRRARFHPEA